MSDELKVETATVVDTTKNEKPAVGDSASAQAEAEKPLKDPTKVRTLQQMAVEKGVKLPQQLSPKELHAQLLLDHHFGIRSVVPAFKALSQHGKDRIFTALLQLPHEGIESGLNGDNEKLIYMAGQKTLMAKHAIVFNRAKRERDAEMAAMAAKAKEKAAAESAEANAVGANPVETKPEVSDTQKVEAPQTQGDANAQGES